MARVSDVRFIAYAVPDLEQGERRFYVDTWGLVEVAEQDGAVYFAAPGSPEQVRGAPTPGRRSLGRADRLGRREPRQGRRSARASRGLRRQDHFAPEPAFGPGPATAFASSISTAMLWRSPPTLSEGLRVRWAAPKPFRRRSAISCCIPQAAAAAVAWYEQALGFRVSDWLGDFMVLPALQQLAPSPGFRARAASAQPCRL
ncbi:hypothetical protein ACRAWD_31985 [Caulobacter segnis]